MQCAERVALSRRVAQLRFESVLLRVTIGVGANMLPSGMQPELFGVFERMFEFVCEVVPIAVGEHADLLCAAVLAKSKSTFTNDSLKHKPTKIVLTVHVADDMGAEATLKLYDSFGNAQESARLGITTTDATKPARHSDRLATMLISDLD